MVAFHWIVPPFKSPTKICIFQEEDEIGVRSSCCVAQVTMPKDIFICYKCEKPFELPHIVYRDGFYRQVEVGVSDQALARWIAGWCGWKQAQVEVHRA